MDSEVLAELTYYRNNEDDVLDPEDYGVNCQSGLGFKSGCHQLEQGSIMVILELIGFSSVFSFLFNALVGGKQD